MSSTTTITPLRKPEQPQASSSETVRNEEQILESIAHGLAESVLEASDDEVLAEVRAEGLDPSQKAEEIRNLLLKATRTNASSGHSSSHQNRTGRGS